MNDEQLEFNLLVQLDDDWITFWEFMYYTIQSMGPSTTSEQTAVVIRSLVESGLMTLGALAANEVGWEEWDVDLDEAMRRIAEGHAGEVGYLTAPDRTALTLSEVVRACITEKGERRLAELEARGFTFAGPSGLV
ncbi:hypothetical protein HQ325_15100 [Rhodococcus sp. BP-349]|uniref:hypothetical protein n=1 Tax=unclassified Rhodococcus (in: high G+C Gram-positive bacteria) TaxID=192944 RepID=UPI001C9A8DB0|nr:MULTISPECIES: hypothetical protein [unclassified Rhodococcus (in: high G+C Gram-positive bacteria)]MBY6540004.1 hypothetical protein [Rhodococcus sp. BP-363]MBY6543668.1 hypothetical protein [Rhodococcus sp. BP-369]MBY6562898.1 hypothetical protein [Rhodococcus sp. BP-370]MBY6577190.1 hypothetical protein [Rhodococcus sp. BP-364]MBY6586491.1 hypothetical protein [Rhodococcus sp. BP-358]